jgi:hypothetical protein
MGVRGVCELSSESQRDPNLQKVKNHWASSTRTKKKKGKKKFKDIVNQLPLNPPSDSFSPSDFVLFFFVILSYLQLLKSAPL